MANINGQRVEPAEIKTVLRHHPYVDKAEILAHTRNNATALIAFVAAMPGRVAGLEAALLETMPLLPGGKIDAQALRALAGGLE